MVLKQEEANQTYDCEVCAALPACALPARALPATAALPASLQSIPATLQHLQPLPAASQQSTRCTRCLTKYDTKHAAGDARRPRRRRTIGISKHLLPQCHPAAPFVVESDHE